MNDVQNRLSEPPDVPDEEIAEDAGTVAGAETAGRALNPLSSSVEAIPQGAWGLLQSDRLFLLVLSSLIALLTIINLVRLSLPGTPAFEIGRFPAESQQFHIDVNEASWVEWIQLPEIGESLARQIVADRESRGPFESIDDLRRVKGIGPVTMEKIRPFLEKSADKK